MNTTSNSQMTRQFSAFSLATLATLAMLFSINLLATEPAPQDAMSAAPAATQVVVIEGHRGTHV